MERTVFCALLYSERGPLQILERQSGALPRSTTTIESVGILGLRTYEIMAPPRSHQHEAGGVSALQYAHHGEPHDITPRHPHRQRLRRSSSAGTASSDQSVPQPPFVAHTGGFGDLVAEIDSSAPIISDRIYGDNSRAVGEAGMREGQDHDTGLGGRHGDIHRNESSRRYRDPTRSSNSSERRHRSSQSGNGGISEDDEGDMDRLHDHLHWARDLPWYRRPDERWLYPFVLLLAIGSGMAMAPKIELCTQLVCEEILGAEFTGDTIVQMTHSSDARADIWNFLPPPHERPPLSSQCRQSAEVEGASLALNLKISLAMGMLSAITTGFWGGLSDRYGRTLTLRVAMLGLTLSDIVYVCVGLFPQTSLPLGKNLLVLAAAAEGSLGGLATLIAAHQAYVAGVTPVGTRASQLSRLGGAFFLGLGLGPALGGVIAKHTNSTMAPFYFALAAHSVYLLTVTLILPESSSPESMRKAREEHSVKMQRLSEQTAADKKVVGAIRRAIRLMMIPVQPLALLLPHRRDQNSQPSATAHNSPEGEAAESHISVSHAGRGPWDFNLTFVALAYFVESLGYGVMTPKIQFAMKTYDWDKEQIGYFLSYASFIRVACLTIVIPLFIKWWHRPPQSTALPQDGRTNDARGGEVDHEAQESTPLLDDDGRLANHSYTAHAYGATVASSDDASDQSFRLDTSSKYVERLWTLRARHLRQIHDSHFDRKLVLLSITIAAACYLCLALFAKLGPAAFIIFSGFVCLSGAAPAGLSSLALSLLDNPTDAGKFFAAWSVLSALSQTILGPLIFSALFIRTVSTAPESIFYLGVGECILPW